MAMLTVTITMMMAMAVMLTVTMTAMNGNDGDVVMKDLCCLGETLLSRRSQLQGFPVEFLLKRPTEQPERNQGVSCRR